MTAIKIVVPYILRGWTLTRPSRVIVITSWVSQVKWLQNLRIIGMNLSKPHTVAVYRVGFS